MIEIGNEAQSLLDLATDGQALDALRHCLALIADHEMSVTELRAVRKEIVAIMRADGASLETVGQAVGRTKQTVAQWVD